MRTDQPEQLISLPTSILPENRVERGAVCQLTALAPPPHGAPCTYNSAKGIRICIDNAISAIDSPNSELLATQSSFAALEIHLKKELDAADCAETFSAIARTKVRHPEWHFLASIGSKRRIHRLCTLYVGLKALLAIRAGKPLSKSTISSADKLLKEDDLTAEQIHALLHGLTPEQSLGQSWPRDLCRSWRDAMRYFSTDDSPPPPSTKERVAGQMLDAALHATASRRAGARSHRQFSKSQLHQSLMHIGIEQEKDTLQGALGVLVCISTFSVDVVAELRLKSNSLDAGWWAEIDIQNGTLTVDYSFIAHEASAPILGAIPASYICTRPLPAKLVGSLRRRAKLYPHACTLKELFPEEAVPAYDSLVFASKDQIQPTWARLRRTIGTFLREAGMDNLLASVISGDFTHVPRSKLYYACVTVDEVTNAFTHFYGLAGWSVPASMSEETLAFGCQVVPTMESLIFLDRHWQEKANASRPGKHCTVENLLKFHNSFMSWTGMRLSLLLALRESNELTILADINERKDRWVPIHDKHVPGDHGAMPVPLTVWVQQTIGSVRAHCKAMQSRLHIAGSKDSDLARWCAAVVQYQPVPLLCFAASASNIRPVGTADFIHGEDIRKLVPPDFGRKAMENLLRANGLRASEIDAILRHALQGQTTNCVTSDTAPLVRRRSANLAITKIAVSIFKEVGFGLAKE